MLTTYLNKYTIRYKSKVENNVKNLVKKSKYDINYIDHNGMSALHYSCIWYPNLVELLLENGAKPNLQNFDGKTPLHIAIKYQPKIVHLLLKYDGNVNLRDLSGKTSLHIACQHHEELINTILNYKCKLSAETNKGECLLLYSCKYNKIQKFKKFLDMGCKLKKKVLDFIISYKKEDYYLFIHEFILTNDIYKNKFKEFIIMYKTLNYFTTDINTKLILEFIYGIFPNNKIYKDARLSSIQSFSVLS